MQLYAHVLNIRLPFLTLGQHWPQTNSRHASQSCYACCDSQESIRELQMAIHSPKSLKRRGKAPPDELRVRLWPCSPDQAAAFQLPAHIIGPRRRRGPAIVGVDDKELDEDAWKFPKQALKICHVHSCTVFAIIVLWDASHPNKNLDSSNFRLSERPALRFNRKPHPASRSLPKSEMRRQALDDS